MTDNHQIALQIGPRAFYAPLLLAIMLLSAGCTGFPPGVPNATPAPYPITTAPPAENCSFGLLTGNTVVHISSGDACYFSTHTPLEFLNDLKMHPDQPVMVIDVQEGWITLHDAELLMEQIDSKEPAAPVVSPISSYMPFNQTSTVGDEALFLLEGYRTGTYPPGLCSLHYFRPNRTEVRSWWDNYGKHGLIDERGAILAVQDKYPDLWEYPSDGLPPRSIKAEKAPDGWYVAFIQEGSGIPILSARCYHVRNNRTVTLTGTVNQSIMVLPDDLSPQRCG